MLQKQKKALILNSTCNDVGMIKSLKHLGYHVTAIGYTPGLIGQKYVDEYIQMDYSDKEAVLELAKRLEIDAICPNSNDFGVLTAAYVAEQLGLPGHDTYENAQIIGHKDKFKAFAREYGIKTPLAEIFSCAEDALQWLEEHSDFPYMVKAADLNGGRGINKVTSLSEAKAAVIDSFSKSRTKQVVIEPFIEGTQHAICAFIVNEKVVGAGSNNEYSIVNPFRVEIDTYPADYVDDAQDVIIAEVEKMASILHLKDGIFQTQYRRTPDGNVWIMECMRRILGNLYSVPSSKLCGFNWDYWETKARCGLDCSDFQANLHPFGFYAYRSLVPAQNGKFSSIEVDEDVMEYVTGRLMLEKRGYQIEDYRNDTVGFLFFEFPDAESMNRIMLDRYSGIKVIVED